MLKKCSASATDMRGRALIHHAHYMFFIVVFATWCDIFEEGIFTGKLGNIDININVKNLFMNKILCDKHNFLCYYYFYQH